MVETMACAAEGVRVAEVPTEIKLLPLGHVHSQKGDFEVDDESCSLIEKAFWDRGIDIVVDYEHQTLENIQAPASGWIKEIAKTDEAIVAKIEWTSKALEYLKNKEYRYLSPVVIVRKTDNKAIRLHSVALTNSPAIDGMYAIVNSDNIESVSAEKTGGNIMELEMLVKLLGLESGATEEDVAKALEKAVGNVKTEDSPTADKGGGGSNTEVVANNTILGLLGLHGTAKTEDVAASILALKAGGTNTAGEILALKEKIEKKEADEAVLLAMKSGKIAAAQKEWATAYALKDPAGFAGFIDKAPAVVPIEKLSLVDAPNPSEKITDNELKVLKEMGLSDTDIEKYVKGGK